jgi:hypothetical protein
MWICDAMAARLLLQPYSRFCTREKALDRVYAVPSGQGRASTANGHWKALGKMETPGDHFV